MISSATFLSFLAINDELKLPRLTEQLESFHAAGLDGVIFQPRFYTGKSEL